jgi:hypothetical protein
MTDSGGSNILAHLLSNERIAFSHDIAVIIEMIRPDPQIRSGHGFIIKFMRDPQVFFLGLLIGDFIDKEEGRDFPICNPGLNSSPVPVIAILAGFLLPVFDGEESLLFHTDRHHLGQSHLIF